MSLFRDSKLVECIDKQIKDCVTDKAKIVCNGEKYTAHGLFSSLPQDIDAGETQRKGRITEFTFFHNDAPITEKQRKDCRIFICDRWWGFKDLEIYHDGMARAVLKGCAPDAKCYADNKCTKSGKRRDRHTAWRSDSGDRKPGVIRRLRRRHDQPL